VLILEERRRWKQTNFSREKKNFEKKNQKVNLPKYFSRFQLAQDQSYFSDSKRVDFKISQFFAQSKVSTFAKFFES